MSVKIAARGGKCSEDRGFAHFPGVRPIAHVSASVATLSRHTPRFRFARGRKPPSWLGYAILTRRETNWHGSSKFHSWRGSSARRRTRTPKIAAPWGGRNAVRLDPEAWGESATQAGQASGQVGIRPPRAPAAEHAAVGGREDHGGAPDPGGVRCARFGDAVPIPRAAATLPGASTRPGPGSRREDARGRAPGVEARWTGAPARASISGRRPRHRCVGWRSARGSRDSGPRGLSGGRRCPHSTAPSRPPQAGRSRGGGSRRNGGATPGRVSGRSDRNPASITRPG
jgi:hypothetical protein